MKKHEKILSILKEWKEMSKGFTSLTLTNEGKITISNDGDFTFVTFKDLIWLNDQIKSVSNWEVGAIYPPCWGESLIIYLGFPKEEAFCLDWDIDLSQSWTI